jgi:hypothetical protein
LRERLAFSTSSMPTIVIGTNSPRTRLTNAAASARRRAPIRRRAPSS